MVPSSCGIFRLTRLAVCACIPTTRCYRYTRSSFYLSTAKRAAKYYLDRLHARFAADRVPAYDIADLPDSIVNASALVQRDASAATIAASGLLELSRYSGASADGYDYAQEAAQMLESLVTGSFSSIAQGLFASTEGAVLHCNAADTDVSWADYYLAEACNRATGGGPW